MAAASVLPRSRRRNAGGGLGVVVCWGRAYGGRDVASVGVPLQLISARRRAVTLPTTPSAEAWAVSTLRLSVFCTRLSLVYFCTSLPPRSISKARLMGLASGKSRAATLNPVPAPGTFLTGPHTASRSISLSPGPLAHLLHSPFFFFFFFFFSLW